MFTPLEENQIRQYIDAEQCRKAWIAAERRAASFRGSMYLKSVKGRDYLYREYQGRSSKSLGLRTTETETVLLEFRQGKDAAEKSYKDLTVALDRNRRLNTALRVGRTPNVVVGLLEEVRRSGLQDHFLVIGTNALYAYETHAGVRFGGDVTATMDMDLLWDSRKRMTLLSDGNEQFSQEGLIGVLKKYDPTFELLEGEKFRAHNSQGYLVDLVKRRQKSLFDETEQHQMVPSLDDFWAAKIVNMDWLLSAPRFKQIVVGTNGSMAEMVTIDPRAFALYKVWLSEKDDREPLKKPRDLAQAIAVYDLVRERMPQIAFEDIHVLPEKLRNARVLEILDDGRASIGSRARSKGPR